MYSCIESISTENTRAPSLDRSAASGRPTTSELRSHKRIKTMSLSKMIASGEAHRLMTVTVLPYALSPYLSILL